MPLFAKERRGRYMSNYTLTIDHESCWGCKTCEAACKQELNTPEGVKLISVLEIGPKMTENKLDFLFQVNICRHCEDPACANVCPDQAIVKRDDGIVVLDDELCTGCKCCIEACPYDAIGFDQTNGVARKCNLCHHRVDKGLLPACADHICLSECINFHDG